MKDLLNDISNPSPFTNTNTNTNNTQNNSSSQHNNNSSGGKDESMFSTLNSLEQELMNGNSNSIAANTITTTPNKPTLASPPPPGMTGGSTSRTSTSSSRGGPSGMGKGMVLPPGLSKPSAGALIVDHAASIPIIATSTPDTKTTTTTGGNQEDAWSQALSQFSSHLTNDFLQANSARKENQQQPQQQNEQNEQNEQMVDALCFENDGEEYDISDDQNGTTFNFKSSSVGSTVGLFPGLVGLAGNVDANARTNANATNTTSTAEKMEVKVKAVAATPKKDNGIGNDNGNVSSIPTPGMNHVTPQKVPSSTAKNENVPTASSSEITTTPSSTPATATATTKLVPPPPPPPPHMQQQLPPHMQQHPMMPPPPPHVLVGHGHPPPPPHMLPPGHHHPHPPPHPHMMPHPPPHMIPSPGQFPHHPPPPPHMMAHPPPGQFPHPPLPPHMMAHPPPGMTPHQHAAMIMQQQQHHQHQHQQQMKAMQAQAQAAQQQTPQKTKNEQQSSSSSTIQNKSSTPAKNVVEKQIVNKMDFPALGANQEQIDQERKEEELIQKQKEEEKIQKKKDAREKAAKASSSSSPRKLPTIRITFQDPSPTAPPVPATSIPSSSMTSRDLCHVLHSIMRPMLTFENVLDAYNADYYHWSYNDRKSRNLLFSNTNSSTDLPNPVWKETKMKALEMESKFRNTVEKRADEWSKEKHALGKIAKANVKRPRALLATTALSSTAESRLTNGSLDGDIVNDEHNDVEMEDYKQRAFMWAARVGIDKGYLAYLNLVELRRLLQSRPGDALSNVDEAGNRREELLHDVEENVEKLHAAFGVGKKEDGTNDNSEISVNVKVLSRTMSLPKGRMLLSRVVDEGILPHPSACHLLAPAIKIIFESSSDADLSAAPLAGEDRLLRSLTGLVQTVRPSVDSKNLIACLTSIIDAKEIMDEKKKKSLKSVLTGKRTLMQLLHSIFTRGGEVCVGVCEREWKAKESAILTILSGNE